MTARRVAALLLCLWPLLATAGDTDNGKDDPRAEWSPAMRQYAESVDSLPHHPDALRAGELARATLDDRTFGAEGDVVRWQWQWQWQWRFEPKAREETPPLQLPEFLAALLAALPDAVGLGGHVALWLFLLLLLAWLWRARHTLPAFKASRATAETTLPAAELAALTRADALPEDVVAAALRLWHGHERRPALALLYRAALTRLGERHGVAIPASGTELECLRRIRRRADAQNAQAFDGLVRHWMRCAYAHEEPPAIEPLVALYRAAIASTAASDTALPAGSRA